MRRPLFAGLLCLASWHAPGQDPEPGIEPARVEGTARWGTIKELTEPEYPQALKDSRARVYVDISGRVAYSGELLEAEFTPGSEEAKPLVVPMRAALKHWRFVPPLDRQCQPSGVLVRTRVSFDFATDPPTMGTRTPDEVRQSRMIKAVSRVDPVFPGHMTWAFGAYVFARVTIDPAGDVTDVIAVAYPKREDVNRTPFADSTIHALRQWKFNTDAEGRGDRQACYDVFYRIAPKERVRR